MVARTRGLTDGRSFRGTDVRTDGHTDGQTYGRTDRRSHGQTDGQTDVREIGLKSDGPWERPAGASHRTTDLGPQIPDCCDCDL